MMKNNILILLGAIGAWFAYKQYRANSSNTVINTGKPINGISEIFTGAKVGQAGAGWRYFTDGSSIAPNGDYYMNDVLVWSKQ